MCSSPEFVSWYLGGGGGTKYCVTPGHPVDGVDLMNNSRQWADWRCRVGVSQTVVHGCLTSVAALKGPCVRATENCVIVAGPRNCVVVAGRLYRVCLESVCISRSLVMSSIRKAKFNRMPLSEVGLRWVGSVTRPPFYRLPRPPLPEIDPGTRWIRGWLIHQPARMLFKTEICLACAWKRTSTRWSSSQ